MPVRPEIFISATSKDLKSCRQLVRDALLTLGCVPVTQDNFPPDARTVREMLREKIAACDAVIHLAGECYGFEPQERAPADPRRSYTQLEYDLARELGKPLYTFLCAPDFPFDKHDPEPADQRTLQDAHRAALAGGDRLYVPVGDKVELGLRVRELQTRIEQLARELEEVHALMARRAQQAEEQNAALHREVEAMRAQLAQQGQVSAQILAAVQQLGGGLTTPAVGRDPVAEARATVAQEQGISVAELQRQLADEGADLRRLLIEIQSRRTAAITETEEWTRLQRETLTKLGNAEYAAGHYAATLDPYRQALALADKEREPLVWCDMARNLECGLWEMGRYAEAEPLARELVEKRIILQGAENSATLGSVNNLAVVLKARGDYAEAEALYRRCLEAQERTLGEEHPDTLQSVNNLAGVLYAKSDHAGAEALYRRCLKARERTLGKEHPDTLSTINNLASVLGTKGDYAQAGAFYGRCIEARERTLGEEHPDTLSSALGLANVLYSQGAYAQAETLYRRCLEAQKRTLGREHPDTAMTAFNLSLMEKSRGKLPEALPLAEEAVAAAKASLPENHPYRLKYEKNLADLRAKLAAAPPP